MPAPVDIDVTARDLQGPVLPVAHLESPGGVKTSRRTHYVTAVVESIAVGSTVIAVVKAGEGRAIIEETEHATTGITNDQVGIIDSSGHRDALAGIVEVSKRAAIEETMSILGCVLSVAAYHISEVIHPPNDGVAGPRHVDSREGHVNRLSFPLSQQIRTGNR